MNNIDLSTLDYSGLKTIIKEFIELYKHNLNNYTSPSHPYTGLRATGNLANIKYHSSNIKIIGNRWISISIDLESYWENVEYGRRSVSEKPEIKPPPIRVIKDWIKVRNIVPRQKNGYLPRPEALPYMIQKSIHKKGIKPTNVFEKTKKEFMPLDKALDWFKDELARKLSEEIKNELEGL